MVSGILSVLERCAGISVHIFKKILTSRRTNDIISSVAAGVCTFSSVG